MIGSSPISGGKLDATDGMDLPSQTGPFVLIEASKEVGMNGSNEVLVHLYMYYLC